MLNYIAVLECPDDYIYVGDVRKLDTEDHRPLMFRGIYCVESNYAYMKIRDLSNNFDTKYFKEKWAYSGWDKTDLVERQITNRYWYDRKDNVTWGSGKEWYKVIPTDFKKREFLFRACKSYKWMSEGSDRHCYSSNPASHLKPEQVIDRPLCHHGYPCEVRLSKQNEIYFDCPVKYIWPTLLPDVYHGIPCDFQEPYGK